MMIISVRHRYVAYSCTLRQRDSIGPEKMAYRGMMPSHHDVMQWTDHQLGGLSANAMSMPVMAALELCIWASMPWVLP